jgi:hypothetical protein
MEQYGIHKNFELKKNRNSIHSKGNLKKIYDLVGT